MRTHTGCRAFTVGGRDERDERDEPRLVASPLNAGPRVRPADARPAVA